MHFTRFSTILKLVIGNYLSFRKGAPRDFNIQLRDTYLAENDIFQGKTNRVDLRFAHDRGLI